MAPGAGFCGGTVITVQRHNMVSLRKDISQDGPPPLPPLATPLPWAAKTYFLGCFCYILDGKYDSKAVENFFCQQIFVGRKRGKASGAI